MFESQKGSTTFHNEKVVTALAMGAIVLSWVTLAAYLLGFVNDVMQVSQNWAQVQMSLPSDFLGQAAAWSGFFRNPLNGLFYFVVLQGVAQVLYVGMDLFYASEEESAEEAPEA